VRTGIVKGSVLLYKDNLTVFVGLMYKAKR